MAIPMRAIGRDLMHNLKSLGIQFIDVYLHHNLMLGVQQTIVINSGTVAINPLPVLAQVGSRLLFFYFGTQHFLTAICFGNVIVIKHEQCRTYQEAEHKHGSGKSMDAYASGLERSDFVVFSENSETDQRGH